MSKLVSIDDILFAREAADFLGISVQRLHQLVSDQVIIPLKKSPSGMLFSIGSLQERKRSLDISVEPKNNSLLGGIDLETPFMREVVNYYAFQSFFGYSDKKTLNWLSKNPNINLKSTLKDCIEDWSFALKVSTDSFLEHYRSTYKAFNNLTEDDIIVSLSSIQYPRLLKMTSDAPPFLFMRGNVDLLHNNIISVIGSRKASTNGLIKASLLAKLLGERGVTVASGLARGIDTSALKGSIEQGYRCIAVIGTPINRTYPKENRDLQDRIAKEGLLISQFPPSAPIQRWNFPLRNAVMSGISLATAIVEASDASGSLKQADYALKQGRLVFIPTSVVENETISWPKRYLRKEGAYQFTRVDELLNQLENHKVIKTNNNMG